jgi:hypothetical protein
VAVVLDRVRVNPIPVDICRVWVQVRFFARGQPRGAGKGRQRGYARGRVNALPALTQPAAIPKYIAQYIKVHE